EAFRDEQQRRGITPVDAGATLVPADGLDEHRFSERAPAERTAEQRAKERIVLVHHQQPALGCGGTAAEHQVDEQGDDEGDGQGHPRAQRVAPQPAEVLQGTAPDDPHGFIPYSRSSLPVSLMNRLSRLGCVNVVPRISALAACRAAYTAGSRPDASASAST